MRHDPARPTVPEVLPLVDDLYLDQSDCTTGSGCVGGHLHIVLDDGNLDNGCVTFCLEEARRDNCQTCIALAEKILAMSPTQRERLYKEHA